MSSFFGTCSQAINGALSSIFRRVGNFCGNRPWLVVLLSFVVVAATGYGFADFFQEGRPERLFNPTGLQAVEDREDYQSFFSSDARFENILIRSALPNKDVLAKNVLLQAYDYWEGLQLINITEPVDNIQVAAKTKCIPLGPGGCFTSSILRAWPTRELLENDTDIAGTINATFTQEEISGFVGFENNVFDLTKGRVLNFFFFLRDEPVARKVGSLFVETDLGANALEEAMLGYSFDRTASWVGTLDVLPRLIASFSQEIGGSIVSDVPYQGGSYALIIVYVLIMVQTRCDRVGSSFAVGTLAIVSVGLGIIAGFGTAQLLDIPYGNTHSVLPFIILGIGVDGCFIILSSFRQTSSSLELSKRAEVALGHAGVSITVTSVTNIAAFAIGSLTVIPDLSSFCKYAALSQFFLYVSQNTFFISCVVLNERRVQQRRLDCLCMVKDCRSEDSVSYGGEYKQSRVSKFLGGPYADFLLQTPVRVAVLVLTFAFLGWMGYNISQLSVEATGDNFIPDGSYLKTNLELTDIFFGGVGTPVQVVIKDIDYFAERADLSTLAAKYRQPNFDTSPPYIDPSFTFWFDELLASLQTDSVTTLAVDAAVGSLLFPTSSENFYAELRHWLNLNPAKNALFAFSDENRTDLLRSVIEMEHVPIGTRNSQGVFDEDATEVVKAVDKMNSITASLGVAAYATSATYTTDWASYAIVQQELVQNVSLALVSVLVVTTLLIGHPGTSLMVFFCVCVTIAELLGVQVLLGLFIDTVVVVLVILAVGLSVDYSAHVGHCFMLKNGTRKERAAKSLEDIGAPVLNGATSTFIAILLQSLSSSYVFRVVFFDFFFAILFGAFNGLVLLPVILSFIGPAAYAEDIEEKDTKALEAEVKRTSL